MKEDFTVGYLVLLSFHLAFTKAFGSIYSTQAQFDAIKSLHIEEMNESFL
jgi:hypothetical protein